MINHNRREYFRELNKLDYRRKKPHARIKRIAHYYARIAVTKGWLIKRTCVVCGRKSVEAHHEDYRDPLGITWLCQSCHTKLHWEARK